MSKSFYEILGISKNATQEDIKKAYRKLARKWHPDINPGNKEAERQFKEISEANDCLSNKEKRKLYDEFGADGLQSGFDAQKARQYRQWNSYEEAAGAEPGHEFGKYKSYEDIFGDVFGFGSGEGGFRTTMAARGRDVEYEMSIDMVSALKGFKTEISMQKPTPCRKCKGSGTDPASVMKNCPVCGGSGRVNVAEGPMHFTKPCPQCHGHGRTGKPCPLCGGSGQVIDTEKIKVSIPPGVKEGSRVRVAGKGEQGRDGGKPGDLYLKIHVKAHPFLKRDGDSLFLDLPVTVGEAMAGSTISIPTIYGSVRLKIPRGSQGSRVLRLKGKGAVNIKTKKKGDLMVKLVIKVPKTDDKEVLESVSRMERFYKGDIRGDISL